MKTRMTRHTTHEVEIAAIGMEIAVRYEEEDIPNDYPHRRGDMWNITVDMDSGQIRNWPAGVEPREVHMNVCDQGSYYLLDPDGKVIASIEQDYVPNGCVPGSYGDYVEFNIDENGRITNWLGRSKDFSRFFGN